jgi:hypothetical protein
MKAIAVLSSVLLCLPLARALSPSTSSIAAKAGGQQQVEFEVHTEKPPQAESGKAQIIVINQVWSSNRVGMDGSWVGANSAHSYLAFSVVPGEHHFCAEWKSGKPRTFTSLTAEPGKTYYLRMRILPEWRGDAKGANAFDLGPISPDEGQYLIESLPRSVSQPKK